MGLVWQSLLEMIGSEKLQTSPYYPQMNTVVERSHRTLRNMLRTMLLEKRHKSWSTLLPTAMLYINNMIQEHCSYSACEILFGNKPNLPSDLSFSPASAVQEDREGYVKQLKKELGEIRGKLNRSLGQQKNKKENP